MTLLTILTVEAGKRFYIFKISSICFSNHEKGFDPPSGLHIFCHDAVFMSGLETIKIKAGDTAPVESNMGTECPSRPPCFSSIDQRGGVREGQGVTVPAGCW